MDYYDGLYHGLMAFVGFVYVVNALIMRSPDEGVDFVFDRKSPAFRPLVAHRTDLTVIHVIISVVLAWLGFSRTALIMCILFQISLVLMEFRFDCAKVHTIGLRFIAMIIFVDAYRKGDPYYRTILVYSELLWLFHAVHEASKSSAFALGNPDSYRPVLGFFELVGRMFFVYYCPTTFGKGPMQYFRAVGLLLSLASAP